MRARVCSVEEAATLAGLVLGYTVGADVQGRRVLEVDLAAAGE
jgi:hypothetical protein